VAEVQTLHAPHLLELLLALFSPFFKATRLLVPVVAASTAINDVFLSAGTGFVPNLVALKAHFSITLERIMGVLATQDAVAHFGVVGALLSHVAKLPAVVAFDGRVFFSEISLALSDFLEVVVCAVIQLLVKI